MGYNEQISLGNKILFHDSANTHLRWCAMRQLYSAVQNSRRASSSNALKAGRRALVPAAPAKLPTIEFLCVRKSMAPTSFCCTWHAASARGMHQSYWI